MGLSDSQQGLRVGGCGDDQVVVEGVIDGCAAGIALSSAAAAAGPPIPET
jgi:hypothetical protein